MPRPLLSALPPLVRLYIRHCIIGYALSAVFVAGLLYANVANLWHLVTHVDIGWLAVVLLVLFNGVVFSGVQFGIAIMRLSDDEDEGGPGRRDAVALGEPVLVPVRHEARPR